MQTPSRAVHDALFDADNGAADHMTPKQAGTWYHFRFHRLLPAMSGSSGDAMIGKYWTIFALSLLFLRHWPWPSIHTAWLGVGLVLIAWVPRDKSCVSAYVETNLTNRTSTAHRVFNWFTSPSTLVPPFRRFSSRGC